MMIGTPPGMLHTIYKSQPTSSGLSPKLWSTAKNIGMSPDGFAAGRFAGSDFMGFGIGTAVTGSVGYYVDEGGTYKSFEDSGTIAPTATVGGQVTLATAATDNHESWLQYGSMGGTLGAIDTAAGASFATKFEARVKFPTVSAGNAFVGMTEEAFAANNGITDAGVMADKDYIGFLIREGAVATLLFVYHKAGGTAAPTVLATYGTVTADTYYKLGFDYNPYGDVNEKLSIFVNNTRLTTFGTTTTLASADFPLAEELSFTMGVKTNGAAIKSLTADWWAYWQERG